jgi:hypothetical protein
MRCDAPDVIAQSDDDKNGASRGINNANTFCISTLSDG